MLTAAGCTTFGSAQMRSRFLFGSAFWGHVVERSGLQFDARFVPPLPHRTNGVIVYLVVSGTVCVYAPRELVFEGPSCLVLTEDAFEGAGGERPFLFRAGGDPFVAVELRFDPQRLRVEIDADRPRAVAVDEETWRAARLLAAARDDAAALAALRSVVARLEASGIIDDAAAIETSGARFTRLWAGMVPLLNDYRALPTLQEVAAGAKISLRQAARETHAFMQTFRAFGPNWRDITRRLRLKLAVLGLSARDATVADVARAAGYGSTDAMARAFRDAGIPAPSEVRAALRDSMA